MTKDDLLAPALEFETVGDDHKDCFAQAVHVAQMYWDVTERSALVYLGSTIDTATRNSDGEYVGIRFRARWRSIIYSPSEVAGTSKKTEQVVS